MVFKPEASWVIVKQVGMIVNNKTTMKRLCLKRIEVPENRTTQSENKKSNLILNQAKQSLRQVATSITRPKIIQKAEEQVAIEEYRTSTL